MIVLMLDRSSCHNYRNELGSNLGLLRNDLFDKEEFSYPFADIDQGDYKL